MYHHFIFLPEYAETMREAQERAARCEAPLTRTERVMFCIMGIAATAMIGGVIYLALNR